MNELGYDPLKILDGTAAAPAFTFKDEPDTGIYRKTTDTIGLAAGGAEIASLAAKALAMGQSAKVFFGSSTLADDGKVALPAHSVFMFGIVLAKEGATFTIFYATALGAVTLVSNTEDVVGNADTDSRLCIGITDPDNPIEIKNRLGDSYDVNYFIVYY